MADDPTGDQAGQTPGEPQAPQTPADPAQPTGDTPTPRMFSEGEVAAARRDAERKAKEAQAEANSLKQRVTELEAAKAEWDQQQQAAEDAKKSDLEKALERVSKAEHTAAQADAARLKAERDAMVASVVAERGLPIPKPFLTLIEGDNEETIGVNIEALMELGRKTFAPKSIGSPASPPNAVPGPSIDDRAAHFKRLKELNEAASDPRHPQHKGSLEELAKMHGIA